LFQPRFETKKDEATFACQGTVEQYVRKKPVSNNFVILTRRVLNDAVAPGHRYWFLRPTHLTSHR